MRILILLVLASASVLAQTPAPKPVATVDIKNRAIVRGKYVALMVGTNKEQVALGGTVTLIVRATPGPKMHVYAPGQQGYTPVALTLPKDADYLARPVMYPKPTLFEFAPLSEKVKVYDAPFTLTQEITISTTRQALRVIASNGHSLIVKGSFTYQACDDTICYRPETLAVEWRIKLMSMLGSRR